MSRRRSRFVVACGTLAALAWFVWRGSSHPPLFELAAEVPYAVRVDWEQARLDLPFSPETRYLLIVSSLGDASCTHSVSLSAAKTTQPGPLPAERLATFRPRATRDPKPAKTWSQPPHVKPSAKTSPRTFHLHVTEGRLDDPRQYAKVVARPIVEGRRVRVYLDGRQRPAELFPGVAEEIADVLDNVVMPQLESALGRVRDVDGDGKFAVLLTPWLGRLEGGKTSLGGFVRASDFRGDLAPPFSNRCDMLYLNSSVRGGAHLRTLLMHEMTHAVCFSERLVRKPGRAPLPDEHDWLNEAIAHVAESADGKSWTNLDYRISRFLNAPQRYPLVVDDYYQAGLWRNHGCRGATFLFLRWCVDQFGEGLLSELVHSPACGTENVARATGIEFAELYRRWTLALWQSGRNGPQQPARRRPKGTFRSVDPYGRVADWNLAGPHVETWDADAGGTSLILNGTATAYVEIEASGPAGHRRVQIDGPFGANLQATLVRLSNDHTRLSVECGWTGTAGTSDSRRISRDDRFALSVWVQSSKAGCRVESISCERNYGETKQSYLFSEDELTPLNTIVADNRGTRIRGYELPIQPRRDAADPLVVKVVVRDDKTGRRAASWATITEPSAFEPVRMADAARDDKVTR